MKRHSVRERLMASTMIGGATLVALSAAPAFAADQPTPAASTVQEVVITGSRIPHPGLTSVSPLTTVSSQDIKLQGVQNVEDLINSLPQAFAQFGAMESNGASGTATVNLRNLGANRTLVLIDGKRLQPGDPTFVQADLNFIPSALVDRVDVITGGASAVYGSDAIAGVVNFIMKKNFEGIRIDVQYGFDQHDQHNSGVRQDVANTLAHFNRVVKLPTGSVTDGGRENVTIVGGANSGDGNGNVTFYFNYQHTDALLEKSRDWSACALATANTNTHFQYCGGSSTSYPGRFIVGGGGGYTLDANGNTVAWNKGDQYNFAPLNYLQRPDERYTAGEFSHYQINPHIDIYSSFMFMHDASFAQIAGSGAFFGDPYAINCDNPMLTTSEENTFCAGHQNTDFLQSMTIGRRDVEGLGRVDNVQHMDYRFVLGMKGEITDGWSYDVYGQYGYSSVENEQIGYFSISKTNEALDVVNVGGVPTCRSVVNGTDPSCVPWNIWNNPAFPGGPTAQQLKFLETSAFSDGRTTEQVVSGNITGDLSKYGIKSPWAKDGVGINVGAEYRRETLGVEFDQAYSSGDLAGFGGAPGNVEGAFDVKEVFGEIRVPIIQDMPFAKELTFEAGYRYADYTSGSVDAYKAGLDWQITPDIRLRGSFERAVRAPNVQELFGPQNPGLVAGFDPCAGSSPIFTLAQCINTHVTPGEYGNIQQCVAAQCNAIFSGNPTLKPETSDTKSLGFVFTPTFVPGFNLSVDWFDISLKQPIIVAPLAAIFETCANSPSTTLLNNGVVTSVCSLITRDTDPNNLGSIIGGGSVALPTMNAGRLHTIGFDVEANYHVSLADWGMGDHGSLNFNLVGTHVSKLETELGVATYDCAGLYGVTCSTPTPKWRHKLRVTWATPWNLSLSAQWRYIGGSSLDLDQCGTVFLGSCNPPRDAHASDRSIPAYNYFDLSGEWRITDRVTMHAGVNNVLDKDPPILDSTSFGIASPPFGNGNTYPQVYDALGRTIFVGITADF